LFRPLCRWHRPLTPCYAMKSWADFP